MTSNLFKFSLNFYFSYCVTSFWKKEAKTLISRACVRTCGPSSKAFLRAKHAHMTCLRFIFPLSFKFSRNNFSAKGDYCLRQPPWLRNSKGGPYQAFDSSGLMAGPLVRPNGLGPPARSR